MAISYEAVTVHGRRIALPSLESFDGSAQVGGGMPEQDERMRLLARAIYGHLLARVMRVQTDDI